MPWDCGKHPVSVHGICAVGFFLAIAWVAAVCSKNTLELMEPSSDRVPYRRAYNLIAAVMVLSPITAYIFNLFASLNSYILIVEVFGIYSFAAYWCVKTKEMSRPDAETRVIAGTAAKRKPR
jgi:hypothetical protein